MVSDVEYEQTKTILSQNFKIESNALYPAGWMFDQDGKIVVAGDLHLTRSQSQLPLRFSKVHGTFTCNNKNLRTLEGCPLEIEGDFDASFNLLSKLTSFPHWVSGSILLNSNKLTSLQGLPDTVSDNLEIQDNPLESLDHLPKSIAWVTLTYSPTIPLLRTLGALHVELIVPMQYKRGNEGKFQQLHKILNSYAGKGKRALFDCQKELEDAGFEENARW